MNQLSLEVQLTHDLKTIKVQVYVHEAPTVIDYNLALNRFFRLKKFRSGHPVMQEFFNHPSSYLAIQTLEEPQVCNIYTFNGTSLVFDSVIDAKEGN